MKKKEESQENKWNNFREHRIRNRGDRVGGVQLS